MTALIIIGSIIAFFALLLSFSATVYISIKEEVTISVGAFGYRYHINLDEDEKPKKEKKKKKSKKKKATDTKKKEASKKPSKKASFESFQETVEFALSIFRSVFKPTVKLLKHTRITKLSLYMTVCSEDADETAIQYGQISIAIYNLLGHLDNLITLKVKSVDIIPDFVSDEAKYDISFKVKLRLCHIIGALISMIVKFLVNTIKNNMKQDHSVEKQKKK